MLTILFAVLCFRQVGVSPNAATTASNLLAHESMFRLGVGLECLSTACSLAVAALLYELLKPVSPAVSLVAAFMRLQACAVAAVGYVIQLAPLVALKTSPSLPGISPATVPSIAFLLQRLHGPASDMVIVFFGFYFVLIGYLIFKSTFLPRVLAILTGMGALGGLTFMAPAFARALSPYPLAFGFIAEASLTLWLLTFGVDDARWNERASAARFA